MRSTFLTSTRQQFEYYKSLGDKTIAQLSDDELFFRPCEQCNSIGMIVKHLWGNMLSRWTDFLNSDGEKEWRDRDGEFEDSINNRSDLLQKWDEGWKCLLDAIDGLNDSHLEQIIYIRNQGHTVTEALNRQLAHYSSHVGQIMLLGKMQRKENWISLSIPAGGSKNYNTEKFSKPQHREHFTEEYIRPKE